MASATEQAVRRLEAALNALERAVAQRLSARTGAAGLSAEVEMLDADRARLAESLDHSQARIARLEGVNRDASRRIAAAVDTIRTVLEADPERR
ncbi:MAG: DUF4164 family protein [Rhizobiales bacterium]|nr:DUF4164 family protein [Hyphomicrobiales bacterium]MDQ3557721.1 DUF4164 domain-containing protein [Pseudomonadota bacterium]